MSDKIRINSIELENYRQYYGNHKIDFSSREEGFTIIAGKNGEGKSNLLNAISWCLYHKEPHGMGDLGHDENRSLPIINNRYIRELGEEKLGRSSVKIWIEKGDTIYSISRVLTVLKHRLEFKKLDNDQEVLLITHYGEDRVPNGCEIIPEQNKFVVKIKGPDDSDFRESKIDSEIMMEEILPERLSKYFLLDGEFLEGFWKDTSIIQEGVEQISQLHLLHSLDNHITSVSILPKGPDKEINSLNTRINQLVWYEQSNDENGVENFSQELRWKPDPDDGEDAFYHASGMPRKKELEEDRQKMERYVRELSKNLSGGNSQNLAHLKNQKIDLETEIDKLTKELKELENKYRNNLVTKSPYVFLKRAIENSVSLIEGRMSAGDLPIRQRRQFADDLLKQSTCICGESLNSDTGDHSAKTRRNKIMKYKETTQGKDDLDAAVDLKYDFRHEFLDDYENFLGMNFGDLELLLSELYVKIDEKKYKLRSANIKLKNYGGEDAEKLLEKQDYLLDEIKKKTEQISEIGQQLRTNSKKLSELRVTLNKKSQVDKKMKRISHAYEIWMRIQAHIRQAYDELKDQIRVEVQKNTWENFKGLLANPTEFQDFTIDTDYSPYLIDAHNINKIHNLSAGQSLILTLAFVAALREPTGYRFPLVVDSPLGKIDGGNRYNFGTRLPGYLPDEQLTLLVTDTEYVAILPPDPDHPNMPTTPVAQLLKEKIGLKHFKIIKDRVGENIGNSSILPAILKHDESSATWMVNVDV